MLQSNCAITFIVQRDQNILDLCTHHMAINAPITPDLLTMIIPGKATALDKPLLINTAGILLATNLHFQQEEGAQPDAHHDHFGPLVEMSTHNDIVVCSLESQGTFIIVHRGKIIQHVPAQALIRYLKNYCLHTEEPLAQGPHTYASKQPSSLHQQRP